MKKFSDLESRTCKIVGFFGFGIVGEPLLHFNGFFQCFSFSEHFGFDSFILCILCSIVKYFCKD